MLICDCQEKIAQAAEVVPCGGGRVGTVEQCTDGFLRKLKRISEEGVGEFWLSVVAPVEIDVMEEEFEFCRRGEIGRHAILRG